MASRRGNCNSGMDSPLNSNSTAGGANRKQSIINAPNRAGTESCCDRKVEKAEYAHQACQGNMTVSSLKTRLAPTIRTTLSAAVDTLLGEVVLVLNETQQELVNKEQENERLKVELRTLQECLSSAQKLIDQLQIPFPGAQTMGQSVFAPSLTSIGSMNTSMDRDRQSHRNVNGADGRCVSGVDLEMSGSLSESLHGYDSRDDYKMCQLSIQPDGSVTNHSMDSYAANTPNICSDHSRPDERRQQQGTRAGGTRFEIKEEQGPGSSSGPGQACRRGPGPRSTGGAGGSEQTAQNVGDLGYIHVVEQEGSSRSGSYSLRHPKPMRPRTATGGPAQGGLAGQKAVLRSPGTVGIDSISPGRAGETAGPSTSPGDPDADRPHHCLECGKTFRLISSLKKHIRIHTGEKPYPCGVCGRRFRESGALKTHLRIHTGEKPYSCSECPKIFRHLDGLRKHQRTHTGDKPYVCAICGKRLSRLQHLKHHQRIHTGEKPCICPFCNRTFKEPAALRKHVRTHREESGNMEAGLGEEPDPDALDNINSLHPAAPSPQMRFDEWGAEGDDVDCV
ncbi:zinc finger protein 697-like [Salvelinus fontinalis]|uniref:zinc finger protein 697-like n=1 Tax=Salvelinus fontinalis TaxID=8038 RepID=UPI0024863368|nr:zinc finger protein 697-like [Salvelinus fontinalis]